MKPLLYIVATLSLAWITHAAPQPLSLINSTTISNLNDITPTTISEFVASDDNEESISLSTINDRKDSSDSTTDDGGTSVSNFESSESAAPREEADQITTTYASVKESSLSSLADDVSPTDSDNANEGKNELNISTTAESVVSKIPEKEESSSEVSVSRYVPPLDPMKHMLMMADIKNIAKLSNFAPKANTSPSPSTVEVTTVENVESEVENVESKVENVESKVENVESTVENVEFKVESSSTESSDVLEKVVAESSEVEEKHEPISTDTTLNDVMRSTVVMKTEDLSTERELISEASSEASSTEIIPTTESLLKEATSDSTESLEIAEEETSAILKNSEAALNIDDATTEIENDSETTGTVFTTTEEAIKVEDLTGSDNLLKAVEELKLETSTSEPKTTTLSTTTEKEIELKNSEISTVKENKDTISTTSTTSVPETTFESSSTGELSSESERKTISLEDELEFRAVKLPLNFSKVSYLEDEPEDSVDPEIVESSPESNDEIELTTKSILTTISEILFSPSSTTESSETPSTEKESELTSLSESESTSLSESEPTSLSESEPTSLSESEPTSLSEEALKTTILPLSVDKEEISESESDSGVVLINDSADMLKVQSIKSELDSVPVIETSTEIPTTEASVSIQPEEVMNDQPVESPEPEVHDNNISTTSEDLPETAKVSLSALEDVSPTILTSTSTAASNPEAEDLYEKTTEEYKEPESQEDPQKEVKPSDYLSNIKDRYVSGDNKDMVAAVQFLHYHDKASSEQCFKLVDAHWNYATNLTEENKKKQLEQTLEYSLFHKEAWKNATSFAWKSFNDTLLRRWFKSLSVLGTAALPEDKLNEFNKLKAEMKNTYSTAKVCSYVLPQSPKKSQIAKEKDCSLTLEPDLQRILTKSRDYDELVHVWKSWRDAAGKPIRDKYLRFVNLSNEAAALNGFSDTGDMWREAYESETFEADLEELWEQLRPLYEHLHAYVRRRLIGQYGSDKIKDDGPIPAHLFGNMWAQSWVSLLDITQPFPGKPSVDVTPNMETKNMTAYDMFKISEEFFTSLGLKAMPEPFWKHSLIEKPKDREIICHASAWDFCNGKDYRIKQCTDITMEDLITVHHEMGHIQYFLQYARQPNVFREGANPGFHEAIGDVLALSVSTPKHLKSIGLLDDVADDPEGDLNFLLYTALDKVSFLPSGYLIDLWRWGLFSGEIKPEEMNSKWWDLRLKYQGICPPVKRTDTDFDPGAKFHVPGNVPYIRYFVSFVIQFQFHKVLCDAAGHNGPLYKCDIYRSKEAGQILSQVMELGSSEHWAEAMKIMTGGATNKMDAGPILEYFDPLLQFLKEQNKDESLGWKSEDATVCP